MRLEDDHPNVYYDFQKGQRVIMRSGQVLVCAVNRYHLMGEVLKVDGADKRQRYMNEVHRL